MPRVNKKYREEAKERIIAAAIEVAKKNGWDAVTLDAIARNVGVSIPALYSYFESREVLLREVVFSSFQDLQSALETMLAVDEDLHRTLSRMVELFMAQHEPYAGIMFQIPTRFIQDLRNQEESSHIFNDIRFIIRDFLARAQSKGELAAAVNPDAAACTIIAVTIGFQIGSLSLELDADAVKRFWLATVEGYLQMGPENPAP